MDHLEQAELIAGTPEYLPPELFENGINIGVYNDWWAFGNILFEMIAGFPPFFESQSNFQVIKQKICHEEPPLHFISNPILRDLIQKLLNKKPQNRLGSNNIQQIKNHDWFFGVEWTELLKQDSKAPFIPNIKSQSDTQWFELEHENRLTPPEQESQKSSIQKYHEFTSSWKSSNDLAPNTEQQCVEYIEIVMNVEQNQNK